MLKFVAVVALAASALAGDLVPITNIKQCDGVESIKAVSVENCSNGERCEWAKGHDHRIQVTYVAPRNAKNIKVLVTGLVGGAELPFPGLKRYICQSPGNEKFCPQEAGKEYTAHLVLPILSAFPKIETTAFVRFIDDDAQSAAEEKMGCFEMKIKLVDDPNAKPEAAVDNQDEDE